MKTYVGIARDHSVSMQSHSLLAMKDYNSLIADIKTAAQENDIDTIVSVVKFGVRALDGVALDIRNSSIQALRPLSHYETTGGFTPLCDGVGMLIESFESVPDSKNPDISFICSVVTDGEHNRDFDWDANRLRQKIRSLQATDRWSFVFRVPRGYREKLSRLLGIPLGNILEWDQTEQGWERATTASVTATRGYMRDLRSGKKATQSFYADVNQVKTADIKREMRDISREVTIYDVDSRSEIRLFVEDATGYPYVKGYAYYELVKTERVQMNKGLIVVNRRSGAAYEGHAARHLLGLPDDEDINLTPGRYGTWRLFVQSTSVNRILPPYTKLLVRSRV